MTDRAPGARTRPRQLTLRDWWAIVRRTAKEMGDDHLSLVAGGVAYAWFLALFPGLLAAVMVYGLVTDPADVERQVTRAAEGLPREAQILLVDQMSRVANSSGQSLSIGLMVGLAVTLWSASVGITGLVEAVTIAYDGNQTRNFVVKRALGLVLTLGFVIFLSLAIGLIGVLPIVLDQLGLNALATTTVDVVRWAGLVLLALLAIGLIYRIGPDRRPPQMRWLSVGAVTATALWVIASAGLAVFVDTFGSYGKTYGSLAGVAILMVWLWITAFAVLLGAEINSEAQAQTTGDTTAGEPRWTRLRRAVRANDS